MNLNDLKLFVERNPTLVRVKASEKYPDLRVLKYERKVFYDNLWTPELEACRGLVLNANWDIVSLPFHKIYNYGIEAQAPRPALQQELMVMRKVNGFMGAATWDQGSGRLVLSTTGSVDSDFVQYFKDCVDLFPRGMERLEAKCRETPDQTHLFEAVHWNDPHIIPEMFGVHYLGSRVKELGSPVHWNWVTAEDGPWHNVPASYMTLAQLLEQAKTVEHEGFVAYLPDGTAFKIKSPFYLACKLFGRGNLDKLLRGKAREYMDEEFYPLIEHVQKHRLAFTEQDEQGRIAFCRNFLSQMFKGTTPWTA